MARTLYAGRPGDTVVSLFELGVGRTILGVPADATGSPVGVTLTVWDEPDGTQLTDLLAADGVTPITAVEVPTGEIQIPAFYGPDGVVTDLYLKDPEGDYSRIDLGPMGPPASNADVAGYITGPGPTADALAASYTQKPTTDLGDWALLRRDTSDVTKGVAWTTPHIAVARVLGWAVVTDAQYAGGADPTGVTDSAAAVQAAHDSLPASGGKLYYPAGTYKQSVAVTITKPGGVVGVGYGSDIKTSSATANIFTASAPFVEMCGLRMTSSVTRTAGWYVDVLSGANRFRLGNFSMDGAVGAIRTAATATCTIEHGSILNGTAGTGIGIRIDDGVDVTISDVLIDAAAQTYAGVYITNAGDVTIVDSQIIHAGNGLYLYAAASKVIASVWSQNTFFDNCTNGVVAEAAGGSIVRSRFTSCWMSSATNWGVNLVTSAGGSIDGTDFLGCHVFLNGAGGIRLGDTGVVNTRIADGAICDNTGDAGILINGAVQKFSIIGNKIGDGYGFTGNGYGIYFNGASAAAYFQISDNDLTGNTVSAIAGTPSLGANRIISNNLGTNMGGTSNPSVTASPFTYTAGPTYETVYINAGTVSLITVDGVAVFQQTNNSVRLGPGKSVVITYSSVPGVAVTKD